MIKEKDHVVSEVFFSATFDHPISSVTGKFGIAEDGSIVITMDTPATVELGNKLKMHKMDVRQPNSPE